MPSATGATALGHEADSSAPSLSAMCPACDCQPAFHPSGTESAGCPPGHPPSTPPLPRGEKESLGLGIRQPGVPVPAPPPTRSVTSARRGRLSQSGAPLSEGRVGRHAAQSPWGPPQAAASPPRPSLRLDARSWQRASSRIPGRPPPPGCRERPADGRPDASRKSHGKPRPGSRRGEQGRPVHACAGRFLPQGG